MKIRYVEEKDAKELVNIYKPYVEDTAISFEYTTPSVEEFKNRIKTTLEKYPYILVEDDGEILGYAYASAFKSRIAYKKSVETSIYVKKTNRSNGIGRMLYEKMEELLKQQGIVNMCACITKGEEDDPKSDPASRKFHEKMGFKLVGEFKHIGYKFDKWYGIVWMQKLIGEL